MHNICKSGLPEHLEFLSEAWSLVANSSLDCVFVVATEASSAVDVSFVVDEAAVDLHVDELHFIGGEIRDQVLDISWVKPELSLRLEIVHWR